jgi:16S rRNA (guanine(966)-N(2))-methyltransferase RsmD
MRIIAGTYRSRLIKAVEGQSTRPTLDKVKEALFTRLGPSVSGKPALDLFAGSGNIGLEAISRGMRPVVFVDGAIAAIRVIHENIKALGVQEDCQVYRMDAFSALRYLSKKEIKFHFVYLDPPYLKVDLHQILEDLIHYDLITEASIIVIESPSDAVHIHHLAYDLEKTSVYGTVALHTYRRKHD